ncbi:immunity 8 family protein [Paraburkholderia kururiensis]|uniref:immunity 8 family protein n=1 Tax=Paraburkholderia kururiensis TaxID=984307 RepID=UPI000F85D81B|nr:immunity 8 family protein [Paraburkholderia kururiensis]
MKAKLKSVDLGSDVGVFEYVPNDPGRFNVWMNFTVGKLGGNGGDLFRLRVCTPDWLKENVAPMSWGRHVLVVHAYNPQAIIDYVDRYISSLEEPDWPRLANKLARVMEWEFEDYKP